MRRNLCLLALLLAGCGDPVGPTACYPAPSQAYWMVLSNGDSTRITVTPKRCE